MPKLDAMLRMMAEKGVERAVLRGDKPYQVFTRGRCIDGLVTPNLQLLAMLEEVVPPSLAPGLRAGSSFHFQHVSPYGAFDLGVSSDLGALQVAISPSKNGPAVSPASPTAPIFPAPASPQHPPLQGVIVPASAPAWPQNAPAPPPAYPAYPPPSFPPPDFPPPASPQFPPPAYPAPYQAYPQPYDPGLRPLSQRSKATAGLLALLFPGLGLHRFYLGYTGTGIVYLLLTFVLSWLTCGLTALLAAIGCVIEGITILGGGMNDAQGRPLF